MAERPIVAEPVAAPFREPSPAVTSREQRIFVAGDVMELARGVVQL